MTCKPETDKQKKIRRQCEIETAIARNDLFGKVKGK